MKNLTVKHSMCNLLISLSSIFVLSLSATQSIATENTSSSTFQQKQLEQSLNQQKNNQQEEKTEFTQAQLEQMLAPIALYPDSLLSHILIATTYPIEVVDAERWLEKNSVLANQKNNQALMDAAEDQDWDASVKALLPFPTIVKKLSNDLHWMIDIGDAFLQDQSKVLASIQSLRQQADSAGNLDSMDNVKVVRETKTIIIQPAEPEVIYVPYYDTRVVYGNWRWSHYPPVYWHYPAHYARHRGPYYWYNPVHLSVGLFFGNVHWRSRHVVVHRHKSRYYKRHSSERVTTNHQSQKWQHKPHHRKGVAYRSNRLQKKYRSHTPSVERHKNMRSEHIRVAKSNKQHNTHVSSRHKNVSQKLRAKRVNDTSQHRHNKHVSNRHDMTKRELNKRNMKKQQPYKDPKWRNAQTRKANQDKTRVKKSEVKKSYNQKRDVQQRAVKENRSKVQHAKAVQVKQPRVGTRNVNSHKSTVRKSTNNRSSNARPHREQRSNQKNSRRNGQQKHLR